MPEPWEEPFLTFEGIFDLGPTGFVLAFTGYIQDLQSISCTLKTDDLGASMNPHVPMLGFKYIKNKVTLGFFTTGSGGHMPWALDFGAIKRKGGTIAKGNPGEGEGVEYEFDEEPKELGPPLVTPKELVKLTVGPMQGRSKGRYQIFPEIKLLRPQHPMVMLI